MTRGKTLVCAAAAMAVVLCAVVRPAAADGKTIGMEPTNAAERELVKIHDQYVAKFQPLLIESKKTWWEANTTGSDDAFRKMQEAQQALVDLHSDAVTYARLNQLNKEGQITQPILKRILDVMYAKFLAAQGNPDLHRQIIALESQVQQTFNMHRSSVDGKELTENEVREILAHTSDSAKAEQAWKAYTQVGGKVDGTLRRLVDLRNRLARELGYKNFYQLSLANQELEQDELFALIDELDKLTAKPFAALKNNIDEAAAKRFRINPEKLRPWHYGDLFFQEAPAVVSTYDLNSLVKSVDMTALASAYYEGLGMSVSGILSRSDLYEKPGKSPHAWCADIDRSGDIRILCNLKPSIYWMDTILHELGHGVYDQYIDPDLPFVLRKASHGMTTEGVALMFGSMSKNEEWLREVRKVDAETAEKAAKSAREALRTEKIVFGRWAQVMIRFEQSMYENPDQDLSKLWYELKKRYQLQNGPDQLGRPDYGAKVHITSTPVYYHNYLLGDLFAAQLQCYIATELIKTDDPNSTCFAGRKDVGTYLKERVFKPGNRYSWNELAVEATGKPLTAEYFAQQFVR